MNIFITFLNVAVVSFVGRISEVTLRRTTRGPRTNQVKAGVVQSSTQAPSVVAVLGDVVTTLGRRRCRSTEVCPRRRRPVSADLERQAVVVGDRISARNSDESDIDEPRRKPQ